MKIKTVAVMGVGAIGAYFIYGLSEKLGEDLWVVADGSRRDRLMSSGIDINGENYRLHVKTPGEARGVDLLIIGVKNTALRQSEEDLRTVVDEHTIVLCPLNGVDSEEVVGEMIGSEHMLYSLMKIVSHREGGSIVFDPSITGGIFFGEPGHAEPTERMLAVAEVFSDSLLHYHMSPDIVTDIWAKYMINVSRNLPQAVIGCGAGIYEDSEYGRFIAAKMRGEVIAVASALGIDVSAAEEGVARMAEAKKSARYSTLQDLDAGRKTEIEAFSGTMVRLGQEHGVPTPYNELIYNFIKLLEEKNEGKFDY